MKIAYLDCFSGISGDMLLGALLDAGLPFEDLKKALATLPLGGYSLEFRREGRSHLHGTRFIVNVDLAQQVPRGIKEIRSIIDAAALSESVKAKTMEIFQAIAEEEGKIHQCPAEEVHFHEVGAVDSILDITGSVFGVHYLGIQAVHASPLPLSSGFVTTKHGRIPLPAPATLALLKGVPVRGTDSAEEMVTPTGAALAKGLADSFGSLPPMVVETIGYGVGSRTLPDRPNLLRIVIGQDASGEQLETVAVLEANLDDHHPEWLGFLMERLFQGGALDVTFTPAQMKKNRPGTAVQVIARPESKDLLMEILFAETTTLGVRFRFSERKVLKRSYGELDSPWGKLQVKKIVRPDGSTALLPEYEACRRVAEEHRLPLRDVYSWVISAGKA